MAKKEKEALEYVDDGGSSTTLDVTSAEVFESAAAPPDVVAEFMESAGFLSPDPSDVRVVIPPTPEPPAEPDVVPETGEEGFLREARAALALASAGEAVSPGEWRRLLTQAVGLVAR